ncbi:MAG: APC family permease [Planctomycetota bacterium]|jgi:amino acid transporter
MTDDKAGAGYRFGTAPVFLAAISTILGAIMFLRFGYAVGNVGLGGALIIILVGHMVTIPTALALAEIATNRKVEGGGEYFIISRSFGTSIGSVIGLALYTSQTISVAFYMIAFAEAFQPLSAFFERILNIPFDPRMVSIPGILILITVVLFRGANIGVKVLYVVAGILFLSLVMFFLGKPLPGAGDGFSSLFQKTENPELFFVVFAICFPAFTGMTAGVGLSGDLANPRKSIPLGTLLGTFIGMLVYIALVIKLSYSASPHELANNQFIMKDIAVWGPIILIGLGCATISSAIGSILVAPRTLQALGHDRNLPIGVINRWLEKGVGSAGEPRNATLVTAAIALTFVALGYVTFVARIISMFFMVTYGSLCAISFLEYFAARPDYRPSFRSRWWVSLFGAVICLLMMFMMDPWYALLAICIIVVLYIIVSANRKGKRSDLAALWEALMGQAMRWMHMRLQQRRHRFIDTQEWRPRVMMVSDQTFDKMAHLQMMRWLCHRHGFGTYLHYIQGGLNNDSFIEGEKLRRKLIKLANEQHMNVSMDTIISPSMLTALAQSLQIPGISGQSNNMALFELSKTDEPEVADELSKYVLFASSTGHTLLVLRHGEYMFGNHKDIHVWVTWNDEETAMLMILLCYVIIGHPDWESADIRIFVALPPAELEEAKEKFDKLTKEGRLPFSIRNMKFFEVEDKEKYLELVSRVSSEADLTVLGLDLDSLNERGPEVFLAHPSLKDVLFVYAPQEIKLD